MHYVKKSSENEMIAVFLQAEIKSDRYEEKIKQLLQKYDLPTRLINKPDLSDQQENEARRQILSDYRGYGRNQALFENFPNTVEWSWYDLDQEELEKVNYIYYDYWLELSGGTRKATDAARKIAKGIEIFGESNERFWRVAEMVKSGEMLPPLIFVSVSPHEKLVVLEGHVRLTAYMLASESQSDKIRVLLGCSPDFTKWDLY